MPGWSLKVTELQQFIFLEPLKDEVEFRLITVASRAAKKGFLEKDHLAPNSRNRSLDSCVKFRATFSWRQGILYDRRPAEFLDRCYVIDSTLKYVTVSPNSCTKLGLG
jgi:hypothetical protein